MTGTVIAAPDKFRGSATAPEIAAAVAGGASAAGWAVQEIPLADGGEGTLDVFGGANRSSTVTGPLGTPIEAGWRLDGTRAVVEMATASGLLVAGGASGNDPIRATTRGTGELIAAAVGAGATDVVVGVGGSATTDGGAGALEVLAPHGATVVPAGVRILVCADVRTRFTEAATVFGPQKGADHDDVAVLTGRLAGLRRSYLAQFGVDVDAIVGSGAAGGLAGGLAAIGARIVPGFDTLAAAAGLDDALEALDPPAGVVVTGEGRFDPTSLVGKVVGGVIARARRRGLKVLVVAGVVDTALRERGSLPSGVTAVSLVERFGRQAAWTEPVAGVRRVVAEYLDSQF
jgi:glycerate kinase